MPQNNREHEENVPLGVGPGPHSITYAFLDAEKKLATGDPVDAANRILEQYGFHMHAPHDGEESTKTDLQIFKDHGFDRKAASAAVITALVTKYWQQKAPPYDSTDQGFIYLGKAFSLIDESAMDEHLKKSMTFNLHSFCRYHHVNPLRMEKIVVVNQRYLNLLNNQEPLKSATHALIILSGIYPEYETHHGYSHDQMNLLLSEEIALRLGAQDLLGNDYHIDSGLSGNEVKTVAHTEVDKDLLCALVALAAARYIEKNPDSIKNLTAESPAALLPRYLRITKTKLQHSEKKYRGPEWGTEKPGSLWWNVINSSFYEFTDKLNLPMGDIDKANPDIPLLSS